MSMSSDFAHLVTPKPISIPVDSHYHVNNNQQYNQFLGTNTQGADLTTHLQFNIKAGINAEWCGKTMLGLSNTAPNKLHRPWALEYLLSQIQDKFDKTCALTLRNLSQDSEFTQLLASHPRTKRVLVEVLQNFEDEPLLTPADQRYKNIDNELLTYTADIVESVSSYYAPLPKDDELLLTLSQIFLRKDDRSLLISIMRSFSRFLVRSETTDENCASNFNSQILDRVASFTLSNDFDLVLTSLDFIYQYSLPGNARVSHLLRSSHRQDIFRSRLPQLLIFQQKITNNPNDTAALQPLRLISRIKPPIPTSAPKLSSEHYRQISILNEPLRATAWMRCCYRSVPDGEVTQISLWKSYELQFEKDIQGTTKRKLLAAVDFIKNVSQAFVHSNAKVINLPNGQRKFIIKGIEPRFASVDIKTGDLEAFGQTTAKVDHKPTSQTAQQEPLDEYTPPTQLNDVNSSSVMLLTSLTNHPLGKELFKPYLEDLLMRVEAFPELVDELVDVLKYLQD